MMKKLLRLNRH